MSLYSSYVALAETEVGTFSPLKLKVLGERHPQNTLKLTAQATLGDAGRCQLAADGSYLVWVEQTDAGASTAIRWTFTTTPDGDSPKLTSDQSPFWLRPASAVWFNCIRVGGTNVTVHVMGLNSQSTITEPIGA